jgi:hypothetical protein
VTWQQPEPRPLFFGLFPALRRFHAFSA